MKRMFLFLFLGLFMCVGCKKVIEQTPTTSKHLDNVAIPIMTDDKSSFYYEVKLRIGHPAEGCPGCVMVNGFLCHIDCQGYGCYCNPDATVKVERDGKSPTFHAITLNAYDLTDADSFFMPSRSLLILDENEEKVWINIPEQMMVRDLIRGNFTIEGITYDAQPLFANN